MKDKILYSQVTKLAFDINEKYYNGKHFVWCSDKPSYGSMQSGNSDPIERSNRIMTAICSQDAHEWLIEENKKGIKKGALYNRKKGIITKKTEQIIITRVNDASFEDFAPLIYVIPYDNVKDVIEVVPDDQKGSEESVEYRLYDLTTDQFDIINIGDAANLRRLVKR